MKQYKQYENFLELMESAAQGDRAAHAVLSRAALLRLATNELVIKKTQAYFRGAKQGNLNDMVSAAICSEYGLCYPRDLSQAAALLEKVIASPEAGENIEKIKTNAEYILGVFLLSGRRGSPTKFALRAAAYLKSAAEKRHPLAQCRLAYAFQTGLGVVKDLPTAIYWYKESVRNGDGEACLRLADIFAMAKEEAAVSYSDLGRAFKGYQLAVCRGVGDEAEVKLKCLEAAAIQKKNDKESRLCVFEDGTKAVLNLAHPAVARLFAPAL